MKQAEIAIMLDGLIRNDTRTFEQVAKKAKIAAGTLRRFCHKGQSMGFERLSRVLAVYGRKLEVVEIDV